MSKEIIVCENLNKTFETSRGSVPVIDNVSLTVLKNELLVLFGPGQCGKSTMINCMAGLEPATGGSVLVGGQKVVKPGPDRGVVYQRMALFPWLTVMGNVEYGPKVRGVPKKERRERAQHYIELVGLKGFENSYPNQLSGGMQQRVGIARAYCNEPDVLFMDEPFGHLDAQTRYLMQEDLMKIWEKEKRTIVFVTNNIEEAIYLAEEGKGLASFRAELPFQYVLEAPGISGACSYDIAPVIEQLTVTAMSSSELDIKAVLGFGLLGFCSVEEDTITDVIISEPNLDAIRELPAIVAYVARDGDDLWTLGKKYYVPLEQIRETNHLSGDTLKAGDKILIVR